MKRLESSIIFKVAIVLIISIAILMASVVFYTARIVNDAGGIKNLIIDAGKEAKDISRAIEKH